MSPTFNQRRLVSAPSDKLRAVVSWRRRNHHAATAGSENERAYSRFGKGVSDLVQPQISAPRPKAILAKQNPKDGEHLSRPSLP